MSRNIVRLPLSARWIAIPMILAVGLFTLTTAASAQTEKVLHNFSISGNAFDPDGGVVFDRAGNLYSTAEFGGQGGGAVFELKHGSAGRWTEQTLHGFSSKNMYALGGVVIDSAGNLYGSTLYGGAYGVGMLFELTPNKDGSWTKKTIHVFGKGKDGFGPSGSLILDSAGNLYGAAGGGGLYGGGTIYELVPNGRGSWNEKILYNFREGADAQNPNGVVFDSAGNIFGASGLGGANGVGAVFELQLTAGGTWTERVLYSFKNDGIDGSFPFDTVAVDSAGNVFGSTFSGGLYNWGAVFELTRGVNGTWEETVIHNFNFDGVDGIEPHSGVVFDKAGNLYGTTFDGGGNPEVDTGNGTVYKLTPEADGTWTETIVHSFGAGNDGGSPEYNVTFDSSGNLYGTTLGGGTGGEGTVWKITR